MRARAIGPLFAAALAVVMLAVPTGSGRSQDGPATGAPAARAAGPGGGEGEEAGAEEPQPCERGQRPPVLLGGVENPFIREASGLAASRAHPGVLWTHQDSGSAAVLHAMARDGRHLGNYRLAGVEPFDWEDVALGPGRRGRDALYVGDIGDNSAVRDRITIHRVPEPDVDLAQESVDIDVPAFETFTLRYPDGPHDAEALVVDPRRGDLFVITKLPPVVYAARAPLRSGRLTRLGPLPMPAGAVAVVTAADATPGGEAVLVRTYFDVVRFPTRGRALVAAFRHPSERLPSPREHQGEAIAAGEDGYYTVAEGRSAPIWFSARCDRER
ncbi:MAG: hypothetical protein ACFCGT_07170 [Sandaracinaceae bacterium]